MHGWFVIVIVVVSAGLVVSVDEIPFGFAQKRNAEIFRPCICPCPLLDPDIDSVNNVQTQNQNKNQKSGPVADGGTAELL